MKRELPIRLSPLVAAALLTACAATHEQAPRDLAAQTETHIDQAEQFKADDYAPVALREARQQLQQARSQMDQEHYPQARRLLEKANVNAEYAIVKTRSEQAQHAAEQIQKDIEALQREMTPS